MYILQGLDFAKLEGTLSKPRVGSYGGLLAATNLGPALGGYFWNLELSAAIFPLLGTVEVALRNAIHQVAIRHYGQPDWYSIALRHAGDRQWTGLTSGPHASNYIDDFYRPTASSFNKKKRTVAGNVKTLRRWTSQAESKLDEVTRRLQKHGISNVPDQVVANSMFGLWLDLFHPSFEDATTTTALWPHCFSQVFPHTTIPDRATMYTKLKSIKDFRNRLSHHEPVWKFGAAVTPLSAEQHMTSQLTTLLDIIGAISPPLISAFERMGVLDRIRWLCSARALNAFAAQAPGARADHRKLGAAVKRALKESQRTSMTVGSVRPSKTVSLDDGGKPHAILVPLK